MTVTGAGRRQHGRRFKGRGMLKKGGVYPQQKEFGYQEVDWNLLANHRLQGHETERMERCVLTLQHIIDKDLSNQGLGLDWCVEKFGSCANGFGTTGADLDVAVIRKGCFDELDATAAVQHLQSQLQPLLQAHPRFTVVQEVYGAKVPILKLRFEHCLEVDVSCHNLRALRNTRLLNAYASLSTSLRDLVVAVKLWAKANGVVGAAEKNLSSYGLSLMALYFLQLEPEVRLPCLPVEAFEYGEDGMNDLQVRELCESWQDPQIPVVHLLVGFFHFYTSCFSWGTETVSIRMGIRLSADEPEFKAMSHRGAQRLHIEDPYELERNLHCVMAYDREMYLWQVMQESLYALQMGVPARGLEPFWKGGRAAAAAAAADAPGDRRAGDEAGKVRAEARGGETPSTTAPTSPEMEPSAQDSPSSLNLDGESTLPGPALTEENLLARLQAQAAAQLTRASGAPDGDGAGDSPGTGSASKDGGAEAQPTGGGLREERRGGPAGGAAAGAAERGPLDARCRSGAPVHETSDSEAFGELDRVHKQAPTVASQQISGISTASSCGASVENASLGLHSDEDEAASEAAAPARGPRPPGALRAPGASSHQTTWRPELRLDPTPEGGSGAGVRITYSSGVLREPAQASAEGGPRRPGQMRRGARGGQGIRGNASAPRAAPVPPPKTARAPRGCGRRGAGTGGARRHADERP